jgi:hypothetical protein
MNFNLSNLIKNTLYTEGSLFFNYASILLITFAE